MCINLVLNKFLTLIERRTQINNLLTLQLITFHSTFDWLLSCPMKWRVCVFYRQNKDSLTPSLCFILISVDGESMLRIDSAVLVLKIVWNEHDAIKWKYLPTAWKIRDTWKDYVKEKQLERRSDIGCAIKNTVYTSVSVLTRHIFNNTSLCS